MKEHAWEDRGQGERTVFLNDGWRMGSTVEITPRLVVCTRCGVSKGMAEHMGWTECRGAA